MTAHGGGRHIHPMPRAAASDDEQVFRTFLTARGFDDRVMAVAFHLYRTTQEAIARAEAEVLRPLRLSWVGYVTLMGLWVRATARPRSGTSPACRSRASPRSSSRWMGSSGVASCAGAAPTRIAGSSTSS